MPKKTLTKVYVFIDAANLWAVQKSKGRLIDFNKLKSFLQKRFDPCELTIYYYNAYPQDGTRSSELIAKRHKFYTYLKKNLGMVVRKKPLKRILVASPDGEVFEEKGNMDVELAIDVIHHIEKYDIGVLLTGDSDFLQLITYMRANGKKCFVYSSRKNVSHELRTGADGYADLLTINSIWGGRLTRQGSK